MKAKIFNRANSESSSLTLRYSKHFMIYSYISRNWKAITHRATIMAVFALFWFLAVVMQQQKAMAQESPDIFLSKRAFKIGIDGALQSAFTQQSFSAAGEITCAFPIAPIGRIKAMIALGGGTDTVRSDFGKTMIRPAINRGFGISFRSDPIRKLFSQSDTNDEKHFTIGLCFHQHTSIGQIWEVRTKSTADLSHCTADITALGLGAYLGYFGTVNNIHASITLDFQYGLRILTNNIIFDENRAIRIAALTQDLVAVNGLDFSLTINIDEITVFYQGVIMRGGIPNLTGGQGVVGLRVGSSKIIGSLLDILKKN